MLFRSVLVAARVGATRLIDNLPVLLGAGPHPSSHPGATTGDVEGSS